MYKIKALDELIERVIPNKSSQISYEIVAQEKRYFAISGSKGDVKFTGSDIIALATAIGHYLKYDVKMNLTWNITPKQIPAILPVPTQYSQDIEQKYISYMNYCTFCYSATWWDYDRWEKELDFMALNGVNLPLFCVGNEKVWYDTLMQLGFSDNEAREFLVGPAFMAWQNMTNIESFAGPLPLNWIDRQYTIGKKIMKRMLEFGMQPIQQSFSGFVPCLSKEKFPNANIIIQDGWCGFKSTALLDPLDPLFKKFGTTFMKNQERLFGCYGFYATDPFHENKPPKEGTEYMQNVSKAITNVMNDVDKNYKWVMQSWSIRKDIACSVDKDRLLILDIDGYRAYSNDYFWGYEFVTGNLHNFGGRTKLHGDLPKLAQNQYMQIKKEHSNIVGSGLFMEGINQNPMYYDLAFEMLTKNSEENLNEWAKEYAVRRYGKCNKDIEKAINILLNTVYAKGTNGVEYSSIITARPAVNPKKAGPNRGFCMTYGNKRLFEALKLIYNSKCDTDGYEYDVVDILREVISNQAYNVYQNVARAFLNRDIKELKKQAKLFYECFDDLDGLLDYRKEFCLDTWVKSAVDCATNEEEANLYDYNAAAQLTIWGYDDRADIFDYAWKEWSGLISQFYKKRWKIFIDMMKDTLKNNGEYIEEGLPQVYNREKFRANEIYNKIADFEVEWVHTPKIFTMRDKIPFEMYIDELIAKYEKCLI